MAGPVPSISRRRVLGAAAAVSVLVVGGQLPATVPASSPAADAGSSRRLWNRRLARYRRIAADAEEAAETGWFREANARYERQSAAIAARFGGRESARTSAEGRRLLDSAFARMSAAEDAYWERCTAPMQRAAVRLAETPAPDVAAVRAKIGVLRLLREHGVERPRRDWLELIEEDLDRLDGSLTTKRKRGSRRERPAFDGVKPDR